MASTPTERYPVKAKSLTLFELCQTINVLRQPLSRNTAQILTRRLYLHPLTISNNAKQHSSKVIANNQVDIEEFNQTMSEKKKKPSKHHDLSILSTSLPLSTRSNTKLTSSINTDRDSSTDFEGRSSTFSGSYVSLPSIPRKLPSSSKRRTVSTRSMKKKPKPVPNNEDAEKIDVWHHLAQILKRPMLKDPPTTPLDILSDSHLQDLPETNYNSIQI